MFPKQLLLLSGKCLVSQIEPFMDLVHLVSLRTALCLYEAL